MHSSVDIGEKQLAKVTFLQRLMIGIALRSGNGPVANRPVKFDSLVVSSLYGANAAALRINREWPSLTKME